MRAVRVNSPLLIVTNPRGADVMKRIDRALSQADLAGARRAFDELKTLMKPTGARRAMRRNPSTGAETFSANVLGVLYVHDEDGNPYAHGFGDADLKLVTKGDEITIRGLKSRTSVCMDAEPDGSITLRGARGQSLWGDF